MKSLSKKDKKKIMVFSNYYPVNLYVASINDLDIISKLFVCFKSTEDLRADVNEEEIKLPATINAATFLVREKNTRAVGIIVILEEDPDLSTLAHESVHYCDGLYGYLYLNTESYNEGNEPYAYLLTWCFECLLEFTDERRKEKR